LPHLNRDGVNLYYEVHGQGPVILLTHGYSATSQMWRGQIEAFKDRYTIVVWDMRGHGETDSPADDGLYSEEATVADMLALLDLVGADKAIVGGLSLGGYMSLAFNRVHPERVRALLIIDTGPGFRKDEARADWNRTAQEMGAKFEKGGLDVLAALSPERSTSKHKSADGLVRAARGMLTQRNSAVLDSLPTIAVPSIVIVGSEDKPFLVATDYMAAKIPGADKAIIDNAGHAANIDQPESFNRALGAFLNRLPSVS